MAHDLCIVHSWVWKIENSKPVAILEASYSKLFTGDSYIILKTVTKKVVSSAMKSIIG
ncbi:hypothetical protein Lser_V15G23948 [Lactuca serriola]